MNFVGQAVLHRDKPLAHALETTVTRPRLSSVSAPVICHPHTPATRSDIITLLQRHHISITYQRIEIAYTLFTEQQHLSADQILATVNARSIKVSKATVYNTLNLFLEKKLIRQLIIDPSKIFYDRNTRPHHHFYDAETGTLTDIPAEGVHIEGLPELPAGVVTDGIDIIVRTRKVD